ncbi:MAG: PhzF family phenazine biosynthesis protein [Steroidobacteraceae bacterium]
MRSRIFKLDAFSHRAFGGNPAAVMPLEAFAPDALLQAIAAENNLSETAFLVGGDGQYQLRWFTPRVEVPLCGHATLASAAVVLEKLEPGRTEVTFQTASGALRVTRTSHQYVMDFPARPTHRIDPPAALAQALGVHPIEVRADAINYLAVLGEERAVRSLAPDIAAIAALELPGVIVTARGSGEFDCVSRYFTPARGVPEDPVTGSAHCALAPYWAELLGRTDLRAYQASRRGGELLCRVRGNRVELEGECVFYLEGTVQF